MIDAAGHGDHFGHGLGHGVGLEVHEAPMMGRGRTGRLSGPGSRHRRAWGLPARQGRSQDRGHPRRPGWRRAGAGTDGGGTGGATHHDHQGTARPVTRAQRSRIACRRHTDVATTNDLKNGMTLNIDGPLWSVVDFQHVKPGKGGAFVRTKLKNVLSGKVVDKTFNAGVRVEVANVDRREMQYLYREGEDFVFMDTTGLRPAAHPGRGRRRRRQLPAGRADGHDCLQRRHAPVRRAARGGRADGPAHRPRPAGRPVDRRD